MFMMKKEIIYQGKRYERFEDLPPEARKAYEQFYALSIDEDQDGIPDVLQGSEGREQTFHWGFERTYRSDPKLMNLEKMPNWLKKIIGAFAKRSLQHMPPPWSVEARVGSSLEESPWEDAWESDERSQPIPQTPPPYEDVSRSRHGLEILLVTLLLLLIGAAVALFLIV
jgi:hypothetical protein